MAPPHFKMIRTSTTPKGHRTVNGSRKQQLPPECPSRLVMSNTVYCEHVLNSVASHSYIRLRLCDSHLFSGTQYRSWHTVGLSTQVK